MLLIARGERSGAFGSGLGGLAGESLTLLFAFVFDGGESEALLPLRGEAVPAVMDEECGLFPGLLWPGSRQRWDRTGRTDRMASEGRRRRAARSKAGAFLAHLVGNR